MGAVRHMLTLADREEISRGIAEGVHQVIAERIGRCPSIVSREIARHGGRNALCLPKTTSVQVGRAGGGLRRGA